MAKAANVVSEGNDWAKLLIQMYTDGCSDAEVAVALKVTIKEYYNQIAENPAFAKLVEFGRTLKQAYWEKQARLNINNKQFNTALFNFYMKNMHGWSDKQDITTQADVTNYNLDDLRGKLAKDVEKFIRQNSPELTNAQRVLSGIGKEAMEDILGDQSIQSE